MADEQLDEHFVELVSSVSHANGVFRVTLGQQVEAGTTRPVTATKSDSEGAARYP